MKQSATLDSSFWINAHRSRLLPQVLERFQLYYASAVAEELSEEFPSGRAFWELIREGTLTQAEPGPEVVAEFGPGERAAINLALAHRDWALLIDDRRPLLEAERFGLKVLCTPVLAIELYTEGVLDARQALEILARLAAIQTVSPSLLAAALALLGVAWKDPDGG